MVAINQRKQTNKKGAVARASHKFESLLYARDGKQKSFVMLKRDLVHLFDDLRRF